MNRTTSLQCLKNNPPCGATALPARRTGLWLAGLGLLLLTLGLTGCSTVRTDESTYNPETGYPAVGTGRPWILPGS